MEFVHRVRNRAKRLILKLRRLRARYQLRSLIAQQSRLRIVIGASGIFEQGWIPTEIYSLNLLKVSDWKFYFKPNSIDALMAEHVWEHITLEDGFIAVRNCYMFLKPGGYLRIAVPDGLHPDSEYIDYVKPGGTGAGADDHKELFTYLTLTDVLEKAGFQVNLLE